MSASTEVERVTVPSVQLPKGGGALRGIGESFAIDGPSGTATASVPLALSPGRSGFGPELSLRYDSGRGNGLYGVGWHVELPSVSRRTDKRVPEYTEDDVFSLSGSDDLVPVDPPRIEGGYRVQAYRPRSEAGFASIECWAAVADGDTHWRVINRDNVTTLFGTGPDTRVADGSRVQRWLIAESWDDKGNWIVHGYKRENADGVDLAKPSEAHRARAHNVHPKWIRYGNRVSRLARQDPAAAGWMFEVVFDYGEHHPTKPAPAESQKWPVRQDSFSDHRAGFEVRTQRLCRRVLMFHHFPDDPAVGADCLVRSTDLRYDENPVLTRLAEVRVRGWQRDGASYATDVLPGVVFDYTPVEFSSEVKTADVGPEGFDGSSYQLVDLDGEGVGGVLAHQAEGWFYRRGEGDGEFAAVRQPARRPAGAGALMDLAGGGRLAVVDFGGERPGFTPRDEDGQWGAFTAFAQHPQVDWSSPQLRLVDLTGDGRADLLFAPGEELTWYRSLGVQGFSAAQVQAMPRVAEDGDRAVFLADMSGDGLADLVSIRDGEVCYWPSLGYGRFGDPVVMDGAPSYPDPFDARRIVLVDIDGTGAVDIVHCGHGGATLWRNLAGNGWGEPRTVEGFPAADTAGRVQAGDLLGTGTGCLMWSSPQQPGVRYLDLLGGRKPHLLAGIRNDMGARTEVSYAPSTRFYLDDRRAGTPWKTLLPFPVHVVAKVIKTDLITGNSITCRYRYRHGWFDPIEREFRGFGLVEKSDTEAYGGTPATLTRTWYHTGKPGLDFSDEYSRLLPPPTVPSGLSTVEEREAWRALRGSMLRQEIYEETDTTRPYQVTEHVTGVARLAPRVFHAHSLHSVDALHERTDDPRITHSVTLDIDAWGNVLRQASIAYGRTTPQADPKLAPQAVTHVTVSEATFTNPVTTASARRAPLAASRRSYELIQLAKAGRLFTVEELRSQLATAKSLPAEDADHAKVADGGPHRRLLSATGTRYRADNLAGLLPPGVLEPLALTGETLTLAITAGMRTAVYTDPVAAADGGYVEVDGDWWIPSGRVYLHPDGAVAAEPAHAIAHFYRPFRYADAFGNPTVVGYDDATLLLTTSRDAVGNETASAHDYRLLQPWRQTDANGNRAEVRFDILGMVIATAVRGKETESLGDTLTGFGPLGTFWTDPQGNAAALLGNATTRFVPDLGAFERDGNPPCVAELARDRHVSDGVAAQIRITFGYSDGFGRVVQSKIQSEHTATPWVGSGTTVHNDKGLPVRVFEPFFSTTHRYEPGQVHGVSTVRCHDPLGREVATVHPDHSYAKVLLDPWRKTGWDAVDTVRLDPRTDPDVARYTAWFFATEGGGWQTWRQLHPVQPEPVGAGTPTQSCVDALGRTFLTIADNGAAGRYTTVTSLDVKGNARRVTDARGVAVLTTEHDLVGRELRTRSADAGERRMLADVTGAPVKGWDSRGFVRTMSYDALRRPVETVVNGQITQKVIYGEGKGAALNHRGRIFQSYDGAGVAKNIAYDFKGNLLENTRQLYASATAANVLATLDTEVFSATSSYDAFNRPLVQTVPHSDVPGTKTSTVRLGYNRAQLLTSVTVQHEGGPAEPIVTGVDYNVRGQRTRIGYGNGVQTSYDYDPQTFRMLRLTTARGVEKLQDLAYRYDPAGNIESIVDTAQDTVFHNQQAVSPSRTYQYDAVYRLVSASGREHRDSPYLELLPNDGQALRTYVQTYDYDDAGNITRMRHLDGATVLWNRAYTYAPDSNRLATTNGDPYLHDPHGNLLTLPGAAALDWDAHDRLSRVDLGGGGEVHYSYDGSGQRVRKVWQKAPGLVEERIYLGGFEIFRRRDGFGQITLERETLHVMDGVSRVALIETRTAGADPAPARLVRYQLADHLESAQVELDQTAQIITYEEYHPYGTSAYSATRSIGETPKRYRYTGKERDEETGLAYHGQRYYAPWLARWTAADPAGLVDGPNRYAYVGGNPVRLNDPSGTQQAPKNDFGGNLPPGGAPPPDTTSHLPPPKDDPPPDPTPDPAPPPAPKTTAKAAPKQTGPELVPSKDTRTQTEIDRDLVLHLNMDPAEYGNRYPDWGFVYFVAFSGKHLVQDVWEAWHPPQKQYLDADQKVQTSTIRPDTSDKGAPAFATLAMFFLPGLKGKPSPSLTLEPLAQAEPGAFKVVTANNKPVLSLPALDIKMTTETSTVADGALNTLEDVGGKTNATTHGAPTTLSGWGWRSQIGDFNPAAENWRFSMSPEGTPYPTHGLDARGAPGSYYASHAEPQLLYINPFLDFMEVSRAPCWSCTYRISMAAAQGNRTIVVLTPQGFMWFTPFGIR